MGGFTMGILRLLPFLMFLGGSALAQGLTYGVGSTPSEEEIRAWDISISPTGEELPPGRGTAKEGAPVFAQKCAVCHGATGAGGLAPTLLKAKAEPNVDPWELGRVLPIRSPYATTVWDYNGLAALQERCRTGGRVTRRPEFAEGEDAKS